MGLWSLFNAESNDDDYSPHWHKIEDGGDYFEIDEEYANLGVKERWLILHSYKYMGGRMGNIYKHRR